MDQNHSGICQRLYFMLKFVAVPEVIINPATTSITGVFLASPGSAAPGSQSVQPSPGAGCGYTDSQVPGVLLGVLAG